MSAPTRTGNCFTAAIDTLNIALEAGAERVMLVHGLPTGTGGDIEGVVHWHAWVEVFTADAGWTILEFSNGKEIIVSRSSYYKIGRLHNRNVWRYSPGDVSRQVVRHEHAGPWVDGWQDMGA